MKNIEQMAAEWLVAKEAERIAVEKRREIEDEICKAAKIRDDVESTETLMIKGFRIKVVNRLTRKVDPDKVQELAAEHGSIDYLSTLFRWKPEINMSVWRKVDESITDPLAPAITIKPGRPSFTIEPTTVKE